MSKSDAGILAYFKELLGTPRALPSGADDGKYASRWRAKPSGVLCAVLPKDNIANKNKIGRYLKVTPNKWCK